MSKNSLTEKQKKINRTSSALRDIIYDIDDETSVRSSSIGMIVTLMLDITDDSDLVLDVLKNISSNDQDIEHEIMAIKVNYGY